MSVRTSALDYDVQKIAAALTTATQQFDSQMRRIDSYRRRQQHADTTSFIARLNRAFAPAPVAPRGLDTDTNTFTTALGYLASIEAACGHAPLAGASAGDWQDKHNAARSALLGRVRDLPEWQAYQRKAALHGFTPDINIAQRDTAVVLNDGVLREDIMVVQVSLPALAPAAPALAATRLTPAAVQSR